MALNTCEMWSNGVKQPFFSKKLRKIAQRLGAPHPDPRQQYVWITVHFFTQHVSLFRRFHILTIGLSPPLWTSSKLRANTRPRLLIFHSTMSLPPQKIPLSKFLMTSLHVIWAPPIKNPGYTYENKSGNWQVQNNTRSKKFERSS